MWEAVKMFPKGHDEARPLIVEVTLVYILHFLFAATESGKRRADCGAGKK